MERSNNLLKRCGLFFFGLIFLNFIIVAHVAADIIYVIPSGETSSWTDPENDLQTAIDAAESGDQIWVMAGTYYPTDGTDREASFELKNNLTVYGGFDGTETDLTDRDIETNETILSGDIGTTGDLSDNSYHVFLHNSIGLDSSAVLDGFTITGGNAFPDSPTGLDDLRCYGGGIMNYADAPLIKNCIFQSNRAYVAGGGATNYLTTSGQPVFANCKFFSNNQDESLTIFGGGGMFNVTSSPEVTNCSFTGNKSVSGGAIYNFLGASPEISGSVFESNEAEYGGAIFNYSNSSSVVTMPKISKTEFYSNSATYGGAVYNSENSDSVFTNCIFSINTTEQYGGAIYNKEAISLINCTLSGNNAVYSGGAAVQTGGGIYNHTNSSRLLVKNSIVWGNLINGQFVEVEDDDLYSEIADFDETNTEVTYSIVKVKEAVYTGTNNMNEDPQFYREPDYSASDYGDLHLHTDANICIDAGVAYNATSHPMVPDDDFEEEDRDDGFPDIGADEFVDTDSDGMPDYWENNYGLDPGTDDSLGDLDGDGTTNIDEYESGFDPTTNADPVAVIRVKPDDLVSFGKEVTLQSDSYDIDNTDMTWLWEQTDSSGNTVTLSPTNEETVTFTTPETACELSFRLTVTSGGATDTATCTVTVENLNEKPEIEISWGGNADESGSGYVVVIQGNTLTGTLSITADSADDGEMLTWSASGIPGDGTIGASSGDISIPTGSVATGTYYVLFQVVDDGTPPMGDSERIAVIVKSSGSTVNRPPVFIFSDSYQYDLEDEKIPGGDQSFFTTAYDADGDDLTYSASDMPPYAEYDTSTGEFTLDEETPSGNYSVLFSVWDGKGGYDYQTVTITVGDINQPPVLTPIGSKAVVVGETLTFTVTATDPDDPSGEGLTFFAANLPDGAAFDQATQIFTWATASGDEDDYDVTFTVMDDGSPIGSDFEEVTITVEAAPIDHPPILEPIGNKTVDVGEALSFEIYASDQDGDTITYNATIDSDAEADGAVFTSDTRTFTWENPTAEGSYEVIFTVTANGKSDSETITITIGSSAYNSPPYFSQEGDKTYTEGDKISIVIRAYDADGDTLTYIRTDSEDVGSFDPSDHVFTWQTGEDDSGEHTLTFQVTDGYNSYVSMSFTITITENNKPVLDPIGDKTATEGETLSFTLSASDADTEDVLSYSMTGLEAAAATLNSSTGAFEWITDDSSAGVYTVTFSVTDANFIVSETITITIASNNQAPVIEKIGDITIEDDVVYDLELTEETEFEVTITASDPDDDVLEFSALIVTDEGEEDITDSLTGASFDSETGLFSWTPPSGTAGTYLIRLTVTDNDSYDPLSDSVDVNLTVLEGGSGDDDNDDDNDDDDDQGGGSGGGGGCFIGSV